MCMQHQLLGVFAFPRWCVKNNHISRNYMKSEFYRLYVSFLFEVPLQGGELDLKIGKMFLKIAFCWSSASTKMIQWPQLFYML